MAQRPLSAKHTYLYIVLTFIFLIVLPGFLLSYFSLTSLGREQLVIEKRYREEHRRQLGLVMRSLDKHFGLMDSSITEDILPRAVDGAFEKDFGKLVLRLLQEDPLVIEAFAVDVSGEVLYPPSSDAVSEGSDLLDLLVMLPPRPGYRGKALRQLHRERGRLLDLYEDGLDIQNIRGEEALARGRHLEITRQAEPLNDDLNLLARGAVATTYYLEKNYEKALGLFREIALESAGSGAVIPALFSGEEIPPRLFACFQWADCARKLGRSKEAAKAMVELYRGLIERRFAVVPKEKDTYVALAVNKLESIMKKDPAGGEVRKEYEALRRKARRERQAKKLGGVLGDSLPGELRSRAGDLDKLLGRRLGYTVESEEGSFHLVFRVAPRRRGGYVAAGFAFDREALAGDILPSLLSDERFSKEISIAAIDKSGTLIAGEKPLQAVEPHLEVPFPPPLSDLRLQVFFRDPSEIGRIFERRRNLDIALISVLVVSILLGVFLVLRFIRKELELVRLRASFVSNVSHELKTPLTSIRMFGEMLKLGRVPDEGKRQEYYDIIAAESERLTKLIDNVLDFSRLEAGKKSYSFAPANPVEVVRRTLQVFSYYMQEQDCEVRTSLDENVPVIRMDQDALSRSVLNLLSNAVKYSREEDRIIDVTVKQVEGHVRISVRDRGIGIGEEDLERIFDQFYRASGKEIPEVSGTGLGLTLVQAVATAHGGRVDVQSSPGKGSIFTISLPIEGNR